MLILKLCLVLAVVIWALFMRPKAIIWAMATAVALAVFSFFGNSSVILTIICWGLFVIALILAFLGPIRRRLLSNPFFKYFRKVLPPMSTNEREALESGDVWWEGDLFCGRPDWQKLHQISKPQLTDEEQAFVKNEVETLCAMLDDWQIIKDNDLPTEVWQYLKDQGFFGLVIDKQYGGKGFSALAHSTIVTKVATRSLTAAVTVMVPNSLGPGELLHCYGTDEQKKHYLPRLAKGEEVPCFALTGIEAGSDAGAMQDTGIVCQGQYQGKEVLGIRLNWNKRYITLAPVATVLGLAFKLYDPDGLLGQQTELGITVCLLPTNHPGVAVGQRHQPSGMAIMNGPTRGQDVFIPLDWIIGGPDMAGKGWRMLMECLSMGRGISLPALGTAGGMLSYRTVSAYTQIRQQFKVALHQFEGVVEAMARVAGYTYLSEATRRMTAGAVDVKVRPSVVSAIAKYHLSEISRSVLNDAMDIHAGRAVQGGPRNYLSNAYAAIPVGITVEGANILTRSLIIFGQGAVRCHPYIFDEMQAVAHDDKRAFDKALTGHLVFTVSNIVRSLVFGLTKARFVKTPHTSLAYYYRQLTRMSSALAMTADFTMLILGGNLKRKERLSARLGDILSALYLSSAVLKYHADENSPADDLSHVQWVLETCLAKAQTAFDEFFANFPRRWLATLLHRIIFPVGRAYRGPSDQLAQAMVKDMLHNQTLRQRLTHLCYIGTVDEPVGRVEQALQALIKAKPALDALKIAMREHRISRHQSLAESIVWAQESGELSEAHIDVLQIYDKVRMDALLVDEFASNTIK